MQPYSLLPTNLLLLSFVTAAPAPAPDITYNPTKEAPCLVTWDIQTNRDIIEHYEVAGHCMFLYSFDKLCRGGYRAPGFCPGENDRAVNCCIQHECGQSKAGFCINSDIPIDPSLGISYSLFADSACPSFWGAPAACFTSTAYNPSPPGGQPVRIRLDGSSPAQPEAQQPQPMPSALSSNNNNNNINPWTVPTTGADVNSGGVGGGGGIKKQDVASSFFDQEQPVAALSVAANGGGPARDAGFSYLDDNQPLLSSGANGDARDGIINPDGSPVDGAATDNFIFDDTS